MALFRSKKTTPAPQARQANVLGRTNAFAYYARRSSTSKSLGRQTTANAAVNERKLSRSLRYWRQRFGLLVVLLAICLGVLNLLSLDTDPVVQPINLTTHVAFLHSQAVYERAAEQLFAGSILNRNKITVDAGAVSAGLRARFPELSVVSVTLPVFGHRPQVYIAQAEPAVLLTDSAGQSFIVDTEGRAVAPGSAARPSLQLIAVHDASAAPIRLGKLVVPSSAVKFIRAMHFQLAQRQVHITGFTLPAATSEVDVHLVGQRYIIKCNLASGGVLEQAGAFLAVQQYFERRGITPSQYVDVRVEGRAYYK